MSGGRDDGPRTPGTQPVPRDDGPGPPHMRPMFRVVAGQPTAEEVAALTVVLAALRAGGTARPARAPAGTPPPCRSVSAWAQRSRLIRGPLQPGPGAWRRSASP